MRVLIFTASAGNGHNSTANRIKEKFLKEQPDSQIEIVDAYKNYAPKIKAWAIEGGYFLLCNKWVSLYNVFFKQQEKVKYTDRDKLDANRQTFDLLNGMVKKIFDFKPDLIICTYIFTAIALTNIKRVYNIPAKVACMTLDYGVSPFWECTCKGLDYMFLTDDYMIQPFLDRGFNMNQLYVTGIPISYEFYKDRDKLQSRKLLGLDENLFTVLIMKASFFPISEQSIVKSLKKINQKLQVVIVNGKDHKSQSKLTKLIKKYELDKQHKIVNLGYTNQIPEYFSACDLIVGKAGGLTTTETIASGLPSLIVNKLPQQEIYNKQHLIDAGCALPVTSKTLASTITSVISNKPMYQQMVYNTLKIRKLNVIDKFYDILKDVPTAIYSNTQFTDTKHETIRKVNKQRLKEVRMQFKRKKA